MIIQLLFFQRSEFYLHPSFVFECRSFHNIYILKIEKWRRRRKTTLTMTTMTTWRRRSNREREKKYLVHSLSIGACRKDGRVAMEWRLTTGHGGWASVTGMVGKMFMHFNEMNICLKIAFVERWWSEDGEEGEEGVFWNE